MHNKALAAGSTVLSCEGIDQTTNTRWGRDGGKHGSVAVIDYLL